MFMVTYRGAKQPFTFLDSTDILGSIEIFDVLKNQVLLNQSHQFWVFYTSKHRQHHNISFGSLYIYVKIRLVI